MPRETWKVLPIEENKFEASSLGRIRISHSKYIISQRVNHNGYLVCRVGSKIRRVSRMIAMAFYGPSDLQVNHKNGNKKDNRSSNLEYCTSFQNMRHAVDSGLLVARKGSKHHRAIVTEQDVLKIRSDFKKGKLNRKELRDKYNMSRQAMNALIAGTSWRHVKEKV